MAGWLEGCILRDAWPGVGEGGEPVPAWLALLTPGKVLPDDRVSVSGLRWVEQGVLVQGPGSKVMAFGAVFSSSKSRFQ